MVLIAALVAAVAAQPGWAASKCASRSEGEAEAAIRYVTDLMVVSSVCQDTVYAEFRLRNQAQIVAYQKALMAHFHGAAGFDRWNTALANQAAQKQNGNQLTLPAIGGAAAAGESARRERFPGLCGGAGRGQRELREISARSPARPGRSDAPRGANCATVRRIAT